MTATAAAQLAAVQDPDVIDGPCTTVSCGIGPCVWTCEHACQDIVDRRARQACRRVCPCDCKATLPAACGEHPESVAED